MIHVGTAVKVNLTIEGLAEEEEGVGYGALIPLNDDDDNDNLIEDRQELAGPVSREDDLTKITIDYWLRDDAYVDDYIGSFTIGGYARVWTTDKKEREIFNGSRFTVDELPDQVWVEGIERGGGSVELTVASWGGSLYTDMVFPFGYYNQYVGQDTSASDQVLVTAGLGLTAYRPMQGPNDYFPFKKTAV